MSLAVPGSMSQTVEAVCSKLAKGVLADVFLHRYNNRTQLKPDPKTKQQQTLNNPNDPYPFENIWPAAAGSQFGTHEPD